MTYLLKKSIIISEIKTKAGIGLQNISFLGTQWTLYQMAFYFVIYAVIGWFIEVCYMTVELGYFQNRGFLNGPICPIHGLGMVMIIIALTPLQHTLFALFFISMFLCTALELIVGIGMEKIFHNTWWDYTKKKFNFKGYICLEISIMWGLGCVLIMKAVQPTIAKLVDGIPYTIGNIVLSVIFAIILADFILSLISVEKLNLRLKQLEDIGKKLRAGSDFIGENVSDEVLELKAKYDKLMAQKRYFQDRFLKAFPDMRSTQYKNQLEELKSKIKLRNFQKKP